ncbi:hypothetical protein AB0C38_37180 [Amycolatopsis sp. NPDC048633]|uniref:hypothetical protein n=1 Tax=Amycolatopsis sp. NPDC048633 TaxID=3157095 RepID=UPI0033EEC59C
MSKRIAHCLTVVAVVAALFTASPGGAVAAPAGWPESCWDGPSKVGNGWMAKCDAGTGKYQAVVFCQVILGGQKLVRQGGWTHAGTWATAFCPGGTNRTSGGINSSPDP